MSSKSNPKDTETTKPARNPKTEKSASRGNISGTGRTIIVGGTGPVQTGSGDQYC
jgi:hypothetical protein